MKRIFPLAGIFYLTAVIILFPYLHYYADNPDTFQYISIAKKYLSFDFKHAVNGYWSPLLSWMLIIPLAIFKDAVTAFKLLQVATGFFVLYQWSRLISAANISNVLKTVLIFLIIPFIIDYALLNCTPDLLFLGMTLLVINIFLSGNVSNDTSIAIKAGIAGAFLFFTKAFGLPLFIAISVAVILFEKKKNEINRNAVYFIYSCFFAISLIWILTLSIHYSNFTISKAPGFNRSLSIAVLEGKEELPIIGSGIIKPEAGQNSAWESPGDYLTETKDISPFEVIRRNIFSIYYFDFRMQAGLIFLALFILYFIRKRREIFENKWLFISLLTITLIYAGYSLILVHSRYIWINTLLMISVSSFIIEKTFKISFIKMIVYLLLFGVAIKRPLKEILFSTDKNTSSTVLLRAAMHPFETLEHTYAPDMNIEKALQRMLDLNLRPGNIASIQTPDYLRDCYATSLRIANSLQSVYYGQVIQAQGDSLKNILSENEVLYLISYDDLQNAQPSFQDEKSKISLFILKK